MTPVYQTRPGADAIAAANAPASEVHPGIWMSPGLSNSYLIVMSDGRVVVNTGMGFEAPVHRANYDAVDNSPIRYIVLTQGHYDHVGGTDVLSDPDYAHAPEELSHDIVALAGADAIVGRARAELADRDPVRAVRLAEIVHQVEPHHDEAKQVLRAAHERLLEASTNFWESAWLRKQIADLT